MANNKLGFAYYSTETDRYQDIKIKRLKKEFKCDGVAVYDYIINEVYRIKGCFIDWDNNVAFDVADYWGLTENRVNEIVNYCCYVGLFDKALFASGSVITSKSIQIRFSKWSKLAKRNEAKIPEEYRLIPEESEIIQEEPPHSSGSLPQRKGKESKVKKSKVEGKEGTRVTAPESAFTPPSFFEIEEFFKDRVPETFWDFAKCKTEAKAFIDYYAKTDWNTSNGPIKKWENAASGWIRNDGKFAAEKKPGKSPSGKKHPDYWSKTWEQALSIEEMKEYWAHMRSVGLTPKKDRAGNVIGWHKE